MEISVFSGAPKVTDESFASPVVASAASVVSSAISELLVVVSALEDELDSLVAPHPVNKAAAASMEINLNLLFFIFNHLFYIILFFLIFLFVSYQSLHVTTSLLL